MLSESMRQSPHLRVHVACEYYDGATPSLPAEHAFAHLAIAKHLRANIETRYYEAGHMSYVHEPSRRQRSADLAAFIQPAA